MALNHKTQMLVGLARQVSTGELIRPQPESQSVDGVPDLVAARGVVRGVVATNERFAALRVLRDIARHEMPDLGFGGQVSVHWDAVRRDLFMGASPYARQLVAEYAAKHDGVVGYLHAVNEDSFEPQEVYSGPHGFRSLRAVQVVGSQALTFNELTDMFGLELQELPDPLSHPDIEHNIRAVYASGVLAMAGMAAELAA